MSYFVVDVEADGPIPGDFSMVSLGAVLVEPGLEHSFKAKLRPVSDHWNQEALRVVGVSREETLSYPEPALAMEEFANWISNHTKGRPMFVSDNNGFDWQFVNWYFHHFLGRNPFGYSSTNMGSLYKGLVKDMSRNFKHLRRTRHTHDPLDDALGNAEAFLSMAEELGLKISL